MHRVFVWLRVRLSSTLGFLSLLEPGVTPERLSLPAVAFWVTLNLIVYLAITSPSNVAAVLTAVGAFVPAALTFVQQSWQQHQQTLARIRAGEDARKQEA